MASRLPALGVLLVWMALVKVSSSKLHPEHNINLQSSLTDGVLCPSCPLSNLNACRASTRTCHADEKCKIHVHAHDIKGECHKSDDFGQFCWNQAHKNPPNCPQNFTAGTVEHCIYCCQSTACIRSLFQIASPHTTQPVTTQAATTHAAATVKPTTVGTTSAAVKCEDLMMNNGCAGLKSHKFCSDRLSLDVCPVTCGHCPLMARLECKDRIVLGNCSDTVKSNPIFCNDSFAIDICPNTCNLCQQRKEKILTSVFGSPSNSSSVPAVGSILGRAVRERRASASAGPPCPSCNVRWDHHQQHYQGLDTCVAQSQRCQADQVCVMDTDKEGLYGNCVHQTHHGCPHIHHHPGCRPDQLWEHCSYCCETEDCMAKLLQVSLPPSTTAAPPQSTAAPQLTTATAAPAASTPAIHTGPGTCTDLMEDSRCADLKARNFCSDRLSLDVCPVTCGHCPLKAKLVCKDSIVVGSCAGTVKSNPIFCNDTFAIDICPVTCNLCRKRIFKILNDAFPSSPVLGGSISSVPAIGKRSPRAEGILCPHCPYVQKHTFTPDPLLLYLCIQSAVRCNIGEICQMDLDKENIKGACHKHPNCDHAPHHPCPPEGLADHCSYCCENDECVYKTLHQDPPTTTPLSVTTPTAVTPSATHGTSPPPFVCQDTVVSGGCATLQAHGFCADRYSVEICPVTCGTCDLRAKLECHDNLIHQSCPAELKVKPNLCTDPFAIDICPVTCNLCDQKRNTVLNAAFTAKPIPAVTVPLFGGATKVPNRNANATTGTGAPSAPLTYTLTTPTPLTVAPTTTPPPPTTTAATTTVNATPTSTDKTTPTTTEKTTPSSIKTTPPTPAATTMKTTPTSTVQTTPSTVVASTSTSAPVTSSTSVHCKDELVDMSCSDLKDVCSSSIAGLVCKRFCGLC